MIDQTAFEHGVLVTSTHSTADGFTGDQTLLAPAYIGTTVPAYTGRETWVGAGSWTPDFPTRRAAAERLFAGTLRPAQARAVVIASGARFLLSDCHGRADVQRLVSAFTDPPHRFGCATVYRVRTGA